MKSQRERHAAAANPSPLPFHLTFGISATAACLAETLTLPLDTAKVRLQLQSLAHADRAALKYRGPFQTIRTMVAEEGPRSLFRGLTPGVHRQFLFTGIRLGLYDRLKEIIDESQRGSGKSGTSLGQQISLAVLTSAIGITVANPSDVLKVRYQADNPNYFIGREERRKTPYKNRSAFESYLKITRTEGVVKGLYKGYAANLVRNSVISASEIVSYGTAKKTLIENLLFEDGIPVHLASGLSAGFVATVLGSPADVLGTKAMQKHGRYAGLTAVQIAIGMAKDEGLFSFYKGFWPNFCRIGSFNIAMWFFYEQIKGSALEFM